MRSLRILLAAAALAVPIAAAAQWQWIDNTGRKVFSDRAPPADIPPKNILKQPGGKPPLQVSMADSPASAPAKPAASAPKLSGKEKELEEKKKQADAAEAEKKRAQEQKMAEAKAEECKRARQSKASLTSGVRISAVDGKGERRYMDEKEIAAETKRADEVIAQTCK